MKKIFVILLSLLFVFSFPSCAADSSDDPSQPISSNETSLTSNDSAAQENNMVIINSGYAEENYPAFEAVQAQYPDKTILVWAFEGLAADSFAHFRTKEINEYLDSLGYDFAVCFTCISTYNDDGTETFYIDRYREMVEKGEQIDILHVFFSNMAEGCYNAYCTCAQYGLFAPLNEYLKSEAGTELYNLMPENYWTGLRINGSIYGVDGTMSSIGESYGYYVNAELADKYGFDVTKPVAEQLDVLQQVKENENCDVFAYGGNKLSSPLYYFSSAKDVTNAVYWDEETESARCVLDDPEFLEKLRLFDTLKKNGLLTDGQYGISGSFFIAQVHVKGGSAVYGRETAIDFDYLDNGNTVKAYPVYNDPVSVRTASNATGICSASQNKDKAFQLLTLTQMDPYLNNLMVYGIEGTDYNMTSDSKSDTLADSTFLRRYANYMICCGNTVILDPPEITAEEYEAIYENAIVYEASDFVFDSKNVIQEVYDTYKAMSMFELPDNDTAIDEAISDMRQSLEEAGIQKIINECNRQYEEWKNESQAGTA